MRVMLDAATGEGLGAGDLLAGTGLTLSQCALPHAEVAATQELRLIRNLLGLADDPLDIGWRMGRHYRITAYGMWGYALMSSRTLGEAARLALRYIGLTYAFPRIELQVREGVASFVLDDSEVPEDVRRFTVQRDLAALVTLAKELVGEEEVARHARAGVAFTGAPVSAQLPCAVGFDDRRHHVSVEAALLDMPLPMANETTAAQCTDLCSALLAQRRRCGSVSELVRARLTQDPARPPSIEEIAAGLGITSRTLRRRLEDEGYSYRALADEARAGLAEQLLRDDRLTLTDVAERLGYTEPSSFIHAFQRWKGISPTRFREALGIQARRRYVVRHT